MFIVACMLCCGGLLVHAVFASAYVGACILLLAF